MYTIKKDVTFATSFHADDRNRTCTSGTPEPKSGASASSATSAYMLFCFTHIFYASASDILPFNSPKIKTLFPIYIYENLHI